MIYPSLGRLAPLSHPALFMFRQEEKERQELDQAAEKQAASFGYTKLLVPMEPKLGQ